MDVDTTGVTVAWVDLGGVLHSWGTYHTTKPRCRPSPQLLVYVEVDMTGMDMVGIYDSLAVLALVRYLFVFDAIWLCYSVTGISLSDCDNIENTNTSHLNN